METQEQINALSPQEQALARAKSSAEKKFELVIAETASVVAQCNSIIITDSTEFGMANQILSKANNALKDAEEKRKNYNRPYADQIAFVNDLVKTKISGPLSDAVEHGKKLLRQWNEAETKKANALKEEDVKRYTFLKTCEANIQKQLILTTTPEMCDKLIMTINSQWPADDKFGNYVAEAIATKNNFINVLTLKRDSIKAVLSNDVAEATTNIQSINETILNQGELSVIAAEKQELIQDSIQAEIGSVRRTWKWDCIDESKLPREFLSIDKKKVDEYMKAHKTEFDINGTIKNGIRFYQDSAPIIK